MLYSDKKILICGDSFAADWSAEYPGCSGWPKLLANHYNVTNLAQAGCSEYRIYKQIKSVDLNKFDLVTVSHTSPYRIYAEYHPRQATDNIHGDCDLLYSDVKYLAKTNKDYQSVLTYFEQFFSIEYAEFSYELLVNEIVRELGQCPVLHLTHQRSKLPFPVTDFSKTYKKYPGVINHYNDKGNQMVFEQIVKLIDFKLAD